MNRLLLVMAGVLLPAFVGCTNTDDVEPKRECELEAFDVSACDPAALASVKAEGIWNANVLMSGVEAPGTVRFLPEALLFDTPLTERRMEEGTFFLAGDYANGSVSSRLALSGCQAPSPERVKGVFRRCANGATDLSGDFEAVRVKRVAGEQEAEGVELVSETPLPRGSAADVFVAGGHAYVTALADGLFIYDVSKPGQPPEKIAELTPANDIWYRAWVKGQTLYVSSYKEGVILYDVSNPKAPTRIPSTTGLQGVQGWGLFVDQDRLYVMSPAPRAEVLIYDIQVPTKLSLLARYYAEESVVANGETPVEGVVVSDRLYVGHWRYGLVVADVSKPTKPVTLGHFGYDKATSRPVAVGLIDGRMIAFEASEGWNSRVRALNVTDPAHIEQVGQFQMRPESTVSAMTLVGTKLYVAHAQDGLRILDVSNPSTPKQQAYYNTWRESDPGRGRAFLEGLSGVKVPGDGYLYAVETSRGLLVFREQ